MLLPIYLFNNNTWCLLKRTWKICCTPSWVCWPALHLPLSPTDRSQNQRLLSPCQASWTPHCFRQPEVWRLGCRVVELLWWEKGLNRYWGESFGILLGVAFFIFWQLLITLFKDDIVFFQLLVVAITPWIAYISWRLLNNVYNSIKHIIHGTLLDRTVTWKTDICCYSKTVVNMQESFLTRRSQLPGFSQ